jgi:DNA-binding PadR family transcriptional regulator
MGLPQALLAALSTEVLSGYDLTRRFDGSLGYFWQASHQQIYRELAKLTDKGLLNVNTQVQAKRPDRKLYTLTQTGHQALKDWLAASVQPPQLRDDLLVKLYAGQWTEPETLIKELKAHQVHHQQKLAIYHDIIRQYFSEATLPYAEACIKLTLDYGITYEQGWLQWCDQALAKLAGFSEDKS